MGIQLNSKFSLTALTVTSPTKKWDIMLFAWVGTPDPASSVNIFGAVAPRTTTGTAAGPRRASCSSNQEFDPAKRTALLNKADELMASHVVTLPLYARPTFLIHQSKLKGPCATRAQFDMAELPPAGRSQGRKENVASA